MYILAVSLRSDSKSLTKIENRNCFRSIYQSEEKQILATYLIINKLLIENKLMRTFFLVPV